MLGGVHAAVGRGYKMNDELTPRCDAEQVKTLEAKIRELEEKLAAADGLAHSGSSAGTAIEGRAERLFEELKPYLDKYRSDGDELLRRVAEKVRENPGASLAIAFGVGLLAAKLFDRGKN